MFGLTRTRILWLATAILLIGLAYLFVKFVQDKTLTIPEAINGFLVAALVSFTAFYAWKTGDMANEMSIQRLDSCRPLLVPEGGQAGISPLAYIPKLGDSWLLFIHNIGMGPATNIVLRIETRTEGSIAKPLINEKVTGVNPLSTGDTKLACQTSTKEVFALADGAWIVIYYDDIYGRHFITEGQFVSSSGMWINIKNNEVKNRPS